METTLNPERFEIGTQFRHDHGGSWELMSVDGDKIVIKPMPGTIVKHKGLLLGRSFKIFGVWFKITNADANSITLQKKVVSHAQV